jgi:methylmalonyl-CoA epimerase
MEEIGEIDHIAIAVKDIDAALNFFVEIFNARQVTDKIELKEEHINFQFLEVGGLKIELLEPTSASGSVSAFLDTRGEGFHHLCFRVKDIGKAIEKIKSMGLKIVGENLEPEDYSNRYAFIHPKNCFGVLIELEEK